MITHNPRILSGLEDQCHTLPGHPTSRGRGLKFKVLPKVTQPK